MTVDTRTGVITDVMGHDEARRLTERIKLSVGTFVEQHDKIVTLLQHASEGNAAQALGYRSWTEYAEHEFAGLFAGLPAAQRQPIAQQFAEAGTPVRSIAAITGVGKSQAADDVSSHRTPEPPAPADDVVDAEIVEDEPTPTPITGRDGKTYQPRPPRAPRADNRKAITDAFRDKATDLLKIVNALTDLAADDRFNRNKEQVAARNGSDLRRAIDALTGVAEQLN